MLHCVALCCSLLQRVAACCSVLYVFMYLLVFVDNMYECVCYRNLQFMRVLAWQNVTAPEATQQAKTARENRHIIVGAAVSCGRVDVWKSAYVYIRTHIYTCGKIGTLL